MVLGDVTTDCVLVLERFSAEAAGEIFFSVVAGRAGFSYLGAGLEGAAGFLLVLVTVDGGDVLD